MLAIFAAIVGGSLAILAVLQTTFEERAFVKSAWFKFFMVVSAVATVVLMICTAIKQSSDEEELERTQTELKAALKGASKTVFPEDFKFHLICNYKHPVQAPTRGDIIDVQVFVIPSESQFFTRWGVTYTPAIQHGMGQEFPVDGEPSEGEWRDLILGGCGFHNFKLSSSGVPATEGPIEQTVAAPHTGPFRYSSLDDYLECKYLCWINAPGEITAMTWAELLIKGQRVPFHLERREHGWFGITVFRPTYDKYHMGK